MVLAVGGEQEAVPVAWAVELPLGPCDLLREDGWYARREVPQLDQMALLARVQEVEVPRGRLEVAYSFQEQRWESKRAR